MNHKIRCRNIICNRYIIHLCNSKKCLNIWIMWLCCQWIGEENNHVDISLYNFCPYLLIST